VRSTTFLGQAYRARSQDLADQLLINMFLNVSETTGTKDAGAFYGTPGLDLKVTLPSYPIRGVYRFGSIMYVVAGAFVYSVDVSFNVTKLGSIGTAFGPISWIDNGESGGLQVAFFDGSAGYLVPGGYPLQSATIGNGGENFNLNDTITLVDENGTSPATAQVTVTGIGLGGTVTSFSITTPGAFTDLTPILSQASSDGGGGGFSLINPVLGPFIGVVPLVLSFNNPTIANYQDGFGVCVEGNSLNVWQSNLFDLSIWDPLTFSNVQARPSDLMSIGFLHRQLVMLQRDTAEVWINQGNPSGFVFGEEQGVHMEVGCVAPYSVSQASESLIWLGQTREGRNAVFQMTGYEAIEISTDAIAYAMAQYPTISDAIGYSFRMEKNVFYVLSFPSANATWVCNVASKDKFWHEWLYFSNGAYSRHRSNCATFFNGRTIVGDYQNGNIYALDMDTYTDNGQAIRRSRSWRALGKPVEDPVRFKYLWIDIDSGVNVTPTANPQIMMDWSDDGGYSWSPERFGSAGKTGQYGWRVKWNRLGSTGRGTGEDRIWRISTSDQFAVAMIGAYQG